MAAQPGCTSAYATVSDAAATIWCTDDWSDKDKALIACPQEYAQCATNTAITSVIAAGEPPVLQIDGATAATYSYIAKELTKEDKCTIIIKA